MALKTTKTPLNNSSNKEFKKKLLENLKNLMNQLKFHSDKINHLLSSLSNNKHNDYQKWILNHQIQVSCYQINNIQKSIYSIKTHLYNLEKLLINNTSDINCACCKTNIFCKECNAVAVLFNFNNLK